MSSALGVGSRPWTSKFSRHSSLLQGIKLVWNIQKDKTCKNLTQDAQNIIGSLMLLSSPQETKWELGTEVYLPRYVVEFPVQ